jgi:hypothetical protein
MSIMYHKIIADGQTDRENAKERNEEKVTAFMVV